jgi:hypothetical protein
MNPFFSPSSKELSRLIIRFASPEGKEKQLQFRRKRLAPSVRNRFTYQDVNLVLRCKPFQVKENFNSDKNTRDYPGVKVN